MTGEECCSQGGKDIHWCSGEFPANQCYDATEMTCCEDGHVCAGDDCCDIVVCNMYPIHIQTLNTPPELLCSCDVCGWF